MLLSFSVNNFLSIGNSQKLSMLKGSVKNKENHLINYDCNLKILKFSAIYGANASGKSNLIKAMHFAKSIIINGVKSDSSRFYCRIDKENKEKITSFDFEIEIDKKFYTYGFDILLASNSIKAEWLYEIDINREKEILVFSKEIGKPINLNAKYFDNEKKIIDRLNVYSEDNKDVDTILFLKTINQNKENFYEEYRNNRVILFQKLFNWFRNSLVIVFPNYSIDNARFFVKEESVKDINNIINKFGTGIKECQLVKSDIQDLQSLLPIPVLKNIMTELEALAIKNKSEKKITYTLRINRELFFISKLGEDFEVKKVNFTHKNNYGEYLFNEESDGTQRLFDLIEILLKKDEERVYVIDELDRCLHPSLTYQFVKMFFETSQKNTQLIVTAHESRLLNFNLLRRDEIWFANRENNGPTKLYSLEKYNERFDKKIDKAYLDGRYGGVPIFETVFPVGEENENS